MSLKEAHEGYEYQDLLISYFILKEIIDETDSVFHIDQKQYAEDLFDDLTIVNSNGIYKKQIKYSNSVNSKTIEKKDLSAGTYQLALDELYFSWLNHPSKSKCNITLCLAWNEPSDTLKDYVKEIVKVSSFDSYPSKTLKIDSLKFWPKNATPPKDWKKFTKSASVIDWQDFSDFLQVLNIEVNLPKFNSTFYAPGELETIVLTQLDKIGLGYYPNDHRTKEEFALALVAFVKRARSQGTFIKTSDVYNEFKLQTDYGAIIQEFPVIPSQNIPLETFTKSLVEKLQSNCKVILTGEPGSGKSWFVENLRNYSQQKNYRVIRHLCYTDLEDAFQKSRISLDVFYGNLINDILSIFPELRNKKEKRFASDLTELNNLLTNIEEETILVIDGIDHIDRIYNFKNYNQDLSLKDIDIVGTINKLTISSKVKILIVSQPVEDLDKIEGFMIETIPRWQKEDIVLYIKKNNVIDSHIDSAKNLSDGILEKSSGNPLYIRYLVTEIRQSGYNNEILAHLPEYNDSLNDYYQYIISKLKLREQLPRILSGVNFSLTKQELMEITGEGSNVDVGLKLMEPVIKLNLSQSGYIIYHESFRRFILEKLEKEGVSLEKNIFSHIVNWFEEKGIYEYTKSFRFYFQFMYELNYLDKILAFVEKEFITKAVFHGHSWSLISNNYKYLLKSALKRQDFPKIVLVSEFNKTLTTTEDEFHEHLPTYLEALGFVRGFQVVSDYLSLEGGPTVGLRNGIEICCLCDKHRISPPWNLYVKYFEKSKKIEEKDFEIYVRYHIIIRDKDKLIDVFNRAKKFPNKKYLQMFRKEIGLCTDIQFIEILKKSNKEFENFMIGRRQKKAGANNLEVLTDRILAFERVSEEETEEIVQYRSFISKEIEAGSDLTKIEAKCVGRNWFSNWIRFIIRAELLKRKKKLDSTDVKNTLSILIHDTRPFNGTPRTCDLYRAENFIYETILDFLVFLPRDQTWDELLPILKKLSNETTTSIQKSLCGPLITRRLFDLFISLSNDKNIDLFIKFMEDELREKEEYHLHADLADYCFKLAILYSVNIRKEDATKVFEKGVQYLLGYTFRKDSTIEDLMYSILSLNRIDSNSGKEYIKKMKSLVDSVVDHTDGKGTKHYPIDWFEKFAEIDRQASLLYLREELLTSSYDWRLEKSLQLLLSQTNGSVDSTIELLLARTFILENEEWFLNCCVNILERMPGGPLAERFLHSIFEKTKSKKNQAFTDVFLNRLRDTFVIRENAVPLGFIERQNESLTPDHIEDKLEPAIESKKTLLEMSINELADHIQDNLLTQEEVNSLSGLFSGLDVSDESRRLIDSFYSSKYRYASKKIDTSVLFKERNELYVYYWVSRYINDYDGWYRSLVNIDAFKKAYEIDEEKAITYLCESLFEKLNLQYFRVVSANLINGLTTIGYKEEIIKQSWNNLFEGIAYRLPSKETYNWDETLRNELDLTEEEILICILFTRFKSYTSERFSLVLSGISHLLNHYPEKLIKPLKWFFENKESFKTSIVLSIIQLVYNYNRIDVGYAEKIKDTLEKLYPSNNLLLDLMIETFYGKEKRKLVLKLDNLIYPINKEDSKYFLLRTERNMKLAKEEIDINNVFGKVKATFKEKYNYQNSLEKYANRSHDVVVRNIYFSDYLLELINEDLYEEIYLGFKRDFAINLLKIDVNLLVAQTNSITMRPNNLKRPFQNVNGKSLNDLDSIDGWIRIGHFETELHSGDTSRLNESKNFGAITFDSDIEQFPICFDSIDFNERSGSMDIEPLIYCFYQMDELERFKVLWLNPYWIRKLKLNVNTKDSISAMNDKNEIVLRFNSWNSNYVGDGNFSGLRDEIPKLEGSELIIREDYFLKICTEFKNAPRYHIRKIEAPK